MAATAKWQRWVPAVAVPAVVAVVVTGGAFAAGASADLPEKTAQQVLELAAQADVQTFSGTVEQTADLGLPDLSSVPGGSSSGASGGSSDGSGSGDASTDSTVSAALELLTGSHSARVYADGPTKARVQVLDQLAERDAIRNGSELWLYDSSDNTVVHSSIPADAGSGDGDGAGAPEASGTVQTPAELAQGFLDAVDPSTDVSLGADTEVAGRSAYDLVLTPRGSETLVGSVSIAVDSETGLPLSVEVLARGASTPAFSVAFSSLSLDTPSADLFDFTPPEGAAVTEKALPTDAGDGSGDHAAAPQGADAHPEPVVTGEGWNTIVALPVGADSADLTSSPLIAQLLTPVDGGQVLQTALVSVLLTDDGRVLAGAVPAEALQSAAAGQ
ncbi:DUF2092 domain-containing protein [Herbiconiux sp.]|uniref:LolA family protein n=1 Tax=Herbiconiux sp. TaxID=1871186 RepID=UPI0025BF7DEA|nr:DUF2092 domain-containing protein [Herbiconiux sp.]